ncbi:fAD dependent oxidoreductase [Bellilinea caldifistulae]|uniref:Fumarate reductase n=1 Tax=Bellilinea caldifistulae TaxID=360411 RepID=A0A0P6XWD3_9CHLR|nr:FAD-dependent oxidoreductase [Bellilinea caldifistulae]KPL73630.1 fumarate reductase [Bellilinea caldifistulae]GAP10265.1 fAD dependent oxidoreductase [Bellilinea caldifistulae]
MMIYSTSLQDLPSTDVLVVGSGSAGATAAITAARLGVATSLVERYGFMGGISTQVLDTFYGFFTPGVHPRKVVGGVPDSVIEELFKRNAAIYRPNTYGAGQGITYDPETLKVVWEHLARQAGVRLYYHALVVDVLSEGAEIRGVVIASKTGLYRLSAKVVIDASGDADVAARMGVPFESSRDGPIQSLTTTFKMINVDVARAKSVKKSELHAKMQQAEQLGYDLPRKEGSVHITPLPGVMATNMTRVRDVDPLDLTQLTLAEIEGRRQSLEYARFLIEQIPGYENAALGGFSIQIGIRESRRIFGEYRLTRADVLSARKFDDAIAQCGAPIEEHHAGQDTRWEYLPEGETYHIPYRCLLPQKAEQLLVAGRCLSADHDAHASVRSMGQCMAMGQAAGTAAALAVALNCQLREVPISKLQSTLRQTGAVLD